MISVLRTRFRPQLVRKARQQLVCVMSIHAHGVGLVNDFATDEFYTTKLDFNSASQLLGDPRIVWDAVEKDANHAGISCDAYLTNIEAAVWAYVQSREICDRATMLNLGVNKVLNKGEGNFGLLLGGKSSGKSLILNHLTQERRKKHEDSILYIDARRSGADLMTGIVQALTPKDWQWLKSLFGFAEVAANHFVPGSGRIIAAGNKLLTVSPDVTPVALIKAFVDKHNNNGNTPCIIIDEANLALPDDDREAQKQTMDVLELFTKLTKQEKKMNVLLATSEHAEPHRLRQLGFNTSNFTENILAGEIPPKHILDLLIRLGVGNNLATWLVGVYGGHLWTVYQAVSALETYKQTFEPMQVLPNISSSVAMCLEDEQRNVDGTKGTREILQQLAETGFAPLEHDLDPRAKRLTMSLDNIAGTVSMSSVTVGIPPQLWGNSRSGLIPATQFARLIIARTLIRM